MPFVIIIFRKQTHTQKFILFKYKNVFYAKDYID